MCMYDGRLADEKEMSNGFFMMALMDSSVVRRGLLPFRLLNRPSGYPASAGHLSFRRVAIC